MQFFFSYRQLTEIWESSSQPADEKRRRNGPTNKRWPTGPTWPTSTLICGCLKNPFSGVSHRSLFLFFQGKPLRRARKESGSSETLQPGHPLPAKPFKYLFRYFFTIANPECFIFLCLSRSVSSQGTSPATIRTADGIRRGSDQGGSK